MAENILVVAHEPADADRVRHALAGQPFVPSFAADADEALRAIERDHPRLIVVSDTAIIPSIRAEHPETPILSTIAGEGTGEFLRRVQHVLGGHPEYTIRHADLPKLTVGGTQLTSKQIFGDLFEEDHSVRTAPRRVAKDDVDKLLADTLSGVLKKKDDTPPRPKTYPGNRDIDKMLADLTMNRRPKPAAGPTATNGNTPIAVPVLPLSAPKPTPAPPLPEEEPTDGIKFGQYVLLEKIATGGMAEVWKARMRGVEGFQKIVAIKKILPHLSDNQEFIGMFVDEAKLAAQLNHNNIIHIYDLGKIQNSYYIAMEFVDGFDLKTILKRAQDRGQPLAIELALFITSKIAAALDYAHRKRDFENRDIGLVHRDVSPQNVLISHEGDIKLCDFGIAKAASKASHTQAGALKGKLQYMSPEQAWGRTIDRRSDIFALAIVLFEMLTARKLFQGENEMSVLEQVREAKVIAPSQLNDEVTPEIDAIVLKALQRNPSNRYQTAAEMARDLDAVLYNWKPTPTSADLAIFMHHVQVAQPIAPPVPVTERAPVPAAEPKTPAPALAPAVAPMPAWDAPHAAAQPKKAPLPLIPIAIAAGVVIVVGTGVWAMRSRASSASDSQSAPRAPRSATVSPRAADSGQQATETIAAVVPAPSTQAPVIDAAKVDEEVRKRLAAEKARLEEQARAQEVLPPPRPVLLTRSAPPPVQLQPQPAAPTPSVMENRQVTQPAETVAQPQPQPQPVAPTPVPATAEPQRVREGDLVPTGTDGLVVARMLRRGSVPYPPLAKMQRVQGTVLISVLVSESGQVLETRLVRGVDRPVGLNEAADQIVRRSTFSPPTKDGVRVKAWTTVPVDFKL
jgi:TonB family protein